MITFPAKAHIRMLAGIALLTCLAFAGTASQAEAPFYYDKTKVTDVEYGLVCDLPISGTEIAPDTDKGEINVIDGDFTFSTHGNVVPAVLGMSFGVKARTISPDHIEGVLFKSTHPPLKDSGVTEESWIGSIGPEEYSSQLYSFEVPTELVTGEWSLSAHKDGELIYYTRFNVVDPDKAPAYLRQLCKGLDLFS